MLCPNRLPQSFALISATIGTSGGRLVFCFSIYSTILSKMLRVR